MVDNVRVSDPGENIGPVTSMCFDDAHSTLAMAIGMEVIVLDWPSQIRRLKWEAHGNLVTTLNFLSFPHGDLKLLTSGFDGELKVWSCKTGLLLQNIPIPLPSAVTEAADYMQGTADSDLGALATNRLLQSYLYHPILGFSLSPNMVFLVVMYSVPSLNRVTTAMSQTLHCHKSNAWVAAFPLLSMRGEKLPALDPFILQTEDFLTMLVHKIYSFEKHDVAKSGIRNATESLCLFDILELLRRDVEGAINTSAENITETSFLFHVLFQKLHDVAAAKESFEKGEPSNLNSNGAASFRIFVYKLQRFMYKNLTFSMMKTKACVRSQLLQVAAAHETKYGSPLLLVWVSDLLSSALLHKKHHKKLHVLEQQSLLAIIRLARILIHSTTACKAKTKNTCGNAGHAPLVALGEHCFVKLGYNVTRLQSLVQEAKVGPLSHLDSLSEVCPLTSVPNSLEWVSRFEAISLTAGCCIERCSLSMQLILPSRNPVQERRRCFGTIHYSPIIGNRMRQNFQWANQDSVYFLQEPLALLL